MLEKTSEKNELGAHMPREDASATRKSRPRRRGTHEPLYAAVDLGTNNCRLLIARRDGETFRVVDSYSQIVRLGEGLLATGRLSDVSMARGFKAMSAIKAKLKQNRVAHTRCVATEACRKAENGEAFIAQARERTGLSFRIIGAKEEARLAAIGCHDLFAPEADLIMVLDIGGGSTEIAFIDLSERSDHSLAGFVKSVPIQAWQSFPLGVVTLTEEFKAPDEDVMYRAMYAHAVKTLGNWKAGQSFYGKMEASNAHLVGTSGTVTCLAGVHIGLDRYKRSRVDGMWLSQEETLQVIGRMKSVGRDGRLALPIVGPDRADLMMSGCAILEAACALWSTSRLRVADRGLREGILLSMMHGVGRRRRRGKRRRRKQTVSAVSLSDQASTGVPNHDR